MAADLCPANSKPVGEAEADSGSLMNGDVDVTAADPKADQDIEDFAKSILRLHARIHDCQELDIENDFRLSVENCQTSEEFSLILHQLLNNGPKWMVVKTQWEQDFRRNWEAQCFQCRSFPNLMSLIAELEDEAIDWSATESSRLESLVGPASANSDGTHPESSEPTPALEETPLLSVPVHRTSDQMDIDAAASPLSPSSKDVADSADKGQSTVSRYGRTRNVPNFARMIDPLSARGQALEGGKDSRAQPTVVQEDMNAASSQTIIDAVRTLVSRAGAPSPAVVAAAAINPHSDKFIGVRMKQTGFGAVIKKNHSEINLGTFSSAEEAARAYDIAALLCQGDRAKLNFSDSLDIVQHCDAASLREAASAVSRGHVLDRGAGLSLTDPSCIGVLLNDIADRVPYGAVRESDANVWETWTRKNEVLVAFEDLGQQLVWLCGELADEVLHKAWRAAERKTWENRCEVCGSGEEGLDLLLEMEHKAIDWERVASVWDAHDRMEAEGGGGGGGEGGENAAWLLLERKDPAEEEVLSEFVKLNAHLTSDGDGRGGEAGGLRGIEATLELVRQAKRDGRGGREVSPRAAMKEQGGRPAPGDRRAAAKSSTNDVLSKGKGLSCRFCGKTFTHAPAHLQHERAHLQQQETRNPSSRIFQHMPAAAKAARAAAPEKQGEGGHGAGDAGREAAGVAKEAGDPKVREIGKEVMELAWQLPVDAAEKQLGSWHRFVRTVAQSDSATELARELAWLHRQLASSVMTGAWVAGDGAAWDADCEPCTTASGLQDLLGRLRRGVDWTAVRRAVEGRSEPAPKKLKTQQHSAAPQQTAPVLVRGDESALDRETKMCIETGMPCPVCAQQNKGIAACFAQGHLYRTEAGELPSSCKDCKQRNKGGLFCFKRGHMPALVPVLSRSLPLPASDPEKPAPPADAVAAGFVA